MQALAVAPTLQHATGELVDDEDLTARDDVILVAQVELFDLQRVVEVADQRGVDRLVQVVDAELVLDLLDARLGDRDGALGLVDVVVLVALQQRRDARELQVPARRVVGGAADDERRSCLIDEDRVDLVDHREEVSALDGLLERPRHVVAQVVEAELVVGAVGDVAVVRGLALVGRHLRVDDADREAEEAVDTAHGLGVALREVVVDRDDVDALAGERVEVGGQRADQRLALTGLHLGDVAEMKRGTAHELDAEVALAESAARRLANRRERLGQQVVERLAVLVALLELVGHRAQLGVGQRLEVRLDLVDRVGEMLQLAQDATLTCAEHLLQNHVDSLPGVTSMRACRATTCATNKADDLLPAMVRRVGGAVRRGTAVGRAAGETIGVQPFTLSAGRLRLRAVEPADVEAVLQACQDPEVLRWTVALPDPYTRADAETFVRVIAPGGWGAGP